LPSARVAGAIRILAGDYASLSSCSYEAIERSGETGLRKADLPASKTPKIVLDPAGVVYWELTFKEVDATSTAVTFNPTRNMWGSDAGGANRFWPAVQSCVSAEAPMRLPTTQRGKPSVYECPANHRSPSGAASRLLWRCRRTSGTTLRRSTRQCVTDSVLAQSGPPAVSTNTVSPKATE
jgi:hypothetical protein